MIAIFVAIPIAIILLALIPLTLRTKGKSLVASEDIGKENHTTWKTVIKSLIPLWILISINVPAIIGLVRMFREASDTSGLSGQAGLMAIGAGLGVVALIAALIVFDLIYLVVWAFLA